MGYVASLAVAETDSVRGKTLRRVMKLMVMSVMMTKMVMTSWYGGRAGGVYRG